jgi:uncharacterized protein with LGFP repeats
MNLIRTISASVLAVVTLTSCVAPAKDAGDKDAKGNKIEYVYVYPTGSNVPVKVPKVVTTSSDSDTAAQDKAMSDLERNGDAHLTQAPGGP